MRHPISYFIQSVGRYLSFCLSLHLIPVPFKVIKPNPHEPPCFTIPCFTATCRGYYSIYPTTRLLAAEFQASRPRFRQVCTSPGCSHGAFIAAVAVAQVSNDAIVQNGNDLTTSLKLKFLRLEKFQTLISNERHITVTKYNSWWCFQGCIWSHSLPQKLNLPRTC